ncbi:hypothetical protein RP20_CCG013492 [Aedes albopictus]|nr:hypothetical protein RP20_CCG013492 [Aedes albopictus]
MHAVGIHSALAIKRQRKRRDNQRKARERRYSIQSSESGDTHSPHGSTRRKFHPHQVHATDNNNLLDTKVVTSIGMLHIGVVFLVFGIFLLGAGFFPDNLSNQSSQSWHLLGHRLERDVETGGLTTRHHRKAMQIQKGAAERGLDDLSNSNILLTPTSSEVVTPTTPSGGKSTFYSSLIRH